MTYVNQDMWAGISMGNEVLVTFTVFCEAALWALALLSLIFHWTSSGNPPGVGLRPGNLEIHYFSKCTLNFVLWKGSSSIFTHLEKVQRAQEQLWKTFKPPVLNPSFLWKWTLVNKLSDPCGSVCPTSFPPLCSLRASHGVISEYVAQRFLPFWRWCCFWAGWLYAVELVQTGVWPASGEHHQFPLGRKWN